MSDSEYPGNEAIAVVLSMDAQQVQGIYENAIEDELDELR